MKSLQENQEEIDKLKQDKKTLQQKNKKLDR